MALYNTWPIDEPSAQPPLPPLDVAERRSAMAVRDESGAPPAAVTASETRPRAWHRPAGTLACTHKITRLAAHTHAEPVRVTHPTGDRIARRSARFGCHKASSRRRQTTAASVRC
eukprot:1002080-Prymnesium_polylepis.1